MPSSEHIEAVPNVREKRVTMCRVCHAHCSLIVEFEAGVPVKAYGDKDNVRSRGFSCIKGRGIHTNGGMPNRVLNPQKRGPQGFETVNSIDAIGEVATRLRTILRDHGPRSVALYSGTFAAVGNPLTYPFQDAFLKAIGSGMNFSSAAIDQPGKFVAKALHGDWASQGSIDTFDVVLLIGTNPIVSMSLLAGNSPSAHLLRARKRGMKLIVIDPRRTETVEHADIFLQPRPGADAAILAGMIRIIVKEGSHDAAFLANEATGFAQLAEAVEPFTVAKVEALSGIAGADLIAAARCLGTSPRGVSICGTGPNMSPGGALVEYLARCLNTVCGHWPRAGEHNGTFNILMHPAMPPTAASTGPYPAWGFGEPMRLHGLSSSAVGLPTAILPDEILLPGEGQIRALLVIGGNPRIAFPDQAKTEKALASLDLMVVVDPKMSATAQLADYLFPTPLSLETPATSSFFEWLSLVGYEWTVVEPYAQYVPAIMAPPPGADVLPEWKFLFLLAREMGLQLTINPISFLNPAEQARRAVTLDMAHDYTTEELFDIIFVGSPIPLDEVRKHGPRGAVLDLPPTPIATRPDGWSARFDIGNAAMMEELRALAGRESPPSDPDFPFLLTSRRLRDRYNTTAHDFHKASGPDLYNPVFMHPDDIARYGLVVDAIVTVTSDAGQIIGSIRSAADMLPGCVSMTHGWAGTNDPAIDPVGLGGNPGRLISTDRDCDPHTWMARQSAIPVAIAPTAAAGSDATSRRLRDTRTERERPLNRSNAA